MSGETAFSKAADIIRDCGWKQVGDEGPGTCIHLAVTKATKYGIELEEAKATMCAHLGLPDISDVWGWNDAPERTVEDVLLALKELHVEAGGA